MKSFLEIALQCCDADDYLMNGVVCAENGTCYGDLRPVGDFLWFSIPSRMGLPPESLIAGNFIVMALSVLLSVVALRKLLARLNQSGVVSASATIFLLITSFVIHYVFLRPTIFNTLSDPPANMLLLSSVWLLILTHFNQHVLTRALQFLLVGLFLGMAAWMRAFFLYPVLAAVAVYMVWWLFSKKKMLSELLILMALVPIAAQYFIMHSVYGTYSYLNKNTTSSWVDVHLNHSFIGFDTQLPRNGYFWKPQHCTASYGILNGLAEGKFGDVACVVMERLYFVLGTYEAKTYITTSVKNRLVGQYSQNIGDINADWFSSALAWERDVEVAPGGERKADKLSVTSPAADGNGDVVQWVPLQGETTYTFSVWLWSPVAKSINLYIARHYDPARIALNKVTLSPLPTRFSVTGTTLTTGLYDIGIGRTNYENEPVSFGTEAGDFFYAWGAQLEEGTEMTSYNGTEMAQLDSIRVWRPALLVVNMVILLLAAATFFTDRKFWLKSRAGVSILVVFLVAIAECMAIIPEQRFAIGFMTFLWVIAVFFIIKRAVLLSSGAKSISF